MSIRPAVSEDYEVLERLWAQQNAHHVALHPSHVRAVDDYLTREAFAEAILAPDREIAVLEEGGRIVAAAILVSRVMDGKYTVPRGVAHVHEIVIDEAVRRQGFGRVLIGYVEDWARARSLQAVELNVWANNAEAMAFYEELGFTPLRYEMHKRLD